jgi:hypothetical protein
VAGSPLRTKKVAGATFFSQRCSFPSVAAILVIHIVKKILLPPLADQHDKVCKNDKRNDGNQDEIQREKTKALGFLDHDQTE